MCVFPLSLSVPSATEFYTNALRLLISCHEQSSFLWFPFILAFMLFWNYISPIFILPSLVSLLNCTVLCMEPSPNCLILALPHLAQLAHCTDPVTFIIFHIEIKVSWALSLWIRATIVVSKCISNALGCQSNAFWLKYAKSQGNENVTFTKHLYSSTSEASYYLSIKTLKLRGTLDKHEAW